MWTVVLHSADFVNKNLVFMADAREIRPGSRLFFSWNEFEPIFCAENNMDGVQDQSVRQCFFPPWHNILLTLGNICFAPEGARGHFGCQPTAAPWANV
jgi:hypothetical protein